MTLVFYDTFQNQMGKGNKDEGDTIPLRINGCFRHGMIGEFQGNGKSSSKLPASPPIYGLCHNVILSFTFKEDLSGLLSISHDAGFILE